MHSVARVGTSCRCMAEYYSSTGTDHIWPIYSSAVSTFWLLWIMLLETFMHKFLGGHIFISLGLDFHFCREKKSHHKLRCDWALLGSLWYHPVLISKQDSELCRTAPKQIRAWKQTLLKLLRGTRWSDTSHMFELPAQPFPTPTRIFPSRSSPSPSSGLSFSLVLHPPWPSSSSLPALPCLIFFYHTAKQLGMICSLSPTPDLGQQIKGLSWRLVAVVTDKSSSRHKQLQFLLVYTSPTTSQQAHIYKSI